MQLSSKQSKDMTGFVSSLRIRVVTWLLARPAFDSEHGGSAFFENLVNGITSRSRRYYCSVSRPVAEYSFGTTALNSACEVDYRHCCFRSADIPTAEPGNRGSSKADASLARGCFCMVLHIYLIFNLPFHCTVINRDSAVVCELPP